MRKYAVSYLFRRRKVIEGFLLFLVIFRVVFWLYGVEEDAVSYAFLLFIATWIVAGGVDFGFCYRRYLRIREMSDAVSVELKEMPVPKSLEEQCYQETIRKLFEQNVVLKSDMLAERKEMLDYYSLWAHQIKTPISAMRLLLQSSELAESEEMPLIRRMKIELFKTEQYVEMVLSYLRMEDISSDLVLRWYSIDEIVRQAIKKYSQMFILQKIQLHYQPLEEMVLTDEKWLLLVLEQVLSNALKYTQRTSRMESSRNGSAEAGRSMFGSTEPSETGEVPMGTGSIAIYMDEKEPKTLVVEDTGIGIYAEDLPRVFEKGFTGYNGRQDKKSTGIGLYLCKEICRKLGHSIRITSEVGVGTKVFLDLDREEICVE